MFEEFCEVVFILCIAFIIVLMNQFIALTCVFVHKSLCSYKQCFDGEKALFAYNVLVLLIEIVILFISCT